MTQFRQHSLNMAAERLACSAVLYAPVSKLPLITDKRAACLEKLDIHSVSDLLLHRPFRYIDLREVSDSAHAKLGSTQSLIMRFHEAKQKYIANKRLQITELSFVDEGGVLIATYFNQAWMAQQYKPGELVLLSGELRFDYGFLRMNHPLSFSLNTEDEMEAQQLKRPQILPVHHATEGLSPAWIRRLVSKALSSTGSCPSFIPAKLRAKYGFLSRERALRYLHFPPSLELAELARQSLAFEELLALQLGMQMRRLQLNKDIKPYEHILEGPYSAALKQALPFELSEEQVAALNQIAQEMAAPRIMNHMLLGDVGTGKTAVALSCLAFIANSNTQAAFMAPSSVLAQQYALKLGPLLDKAKVSWALLIGGMKKEERNKILEDCSKGKISVLFGTHALLEDDLQFKKLSLVIIDEQHRFGVKQRSKLRAKGPGADLLVMTATPIPRSLALSIYGDLSCSYITQRPLAGAGVSTQLLKKSDRGIAYDEIKRQVQEGRQAYIICPLIGTKADAESSAGMETEEIYEQSRETIKAAKKEAAFLSKKVFPELVVGLLTGDMSTQEKDEIMDRFRRGLIQVLVSTTVIEVGVDVPNATVMIIEDAERFGLSQLHQLRGRVGRGSWPGSVFLIAQARSKQSHERLKLMEEISDGFQLAEKDLELRGQGELLGSAQHGSWRLHFAELIADKELIALAQKLAIRISEEDPYLNSAHYSLLRDLIVRRYGDVFTQVSGA